MEVRSWPEGTPTIMIYEGELAQEYFDRRRSAVLASPEITADLMNVTCRDIRYQVIKHPATLSEVEVARLTNELTELSRKTTSYGDGNYLPALTGWRKYYEYHGARPNDYSRLSLVYDRETLISCSAVKKLTLSDATNTDLIWLQLAMTLPKYQRSGIAATSLLKMLDDDFLSLLSQGYLVVRTPNPMVYEMVRRFLPIFAHKGLTGRLFPVIKCATAIEDISENEKVEIVEVLRRISPNSPFDTTTFVIGGYYKQFGALYKKYDFYCRNTDVREYFGKHLRCENQDGIAIVVKYQNQNKLQVVRP